jgi:hypothetical protein
MGTTTRIISVLIAAATAGILARAQSGASQTQTAKIELRLLFVGTAPDAEGKAATCAARTRDFAEFLGREFKSVRVVARDCFDPQSAADADVVLLDWSQSDVDLDKMGELKSPLGPREAWTHPTVLLGSAGLLLAGPWQIKGAYG